MIAFVRWGTGGSALVCVCNFSGRPHEDYRLPLPFTGEWDEVLNTDADLYGGSGVGNMGVVTATEQPYGDQPGRAPPCDCLRSARCGSPAAGAEAAVY